MRADNIMTRDVYFVDATEDLSAVWEMMKKLHIRHVPVVEGGRPIGIVSDRDVLLRSRLEHGEITTPAQPVSSVMSSPVVTALPGSSLSAIGLQMLSHKIDSIVVVSPDDGALAGMITTSDFIRLVLEREAIDLHQPPGVQYRVQRLPR